MNLICCSQDYGISFPRSLRTQELNCYKFIQAMVTIDVYWLIIVCQESWLASCIYKTLQRRLVNRFQAINISQASSKVQAQGQYPPPPPSYPHASHHVRQHHHVPGCRWQQQKQRLLQQPGFSGGPAKTALKTSKVSLPWRKPYNGACGPPPGPFCSGLWSYLQAITAF